MYIITEGQTCFIHRIHICIGIVVENNTNRQLSQNLFTTTMPTLLSFPQNILHYTLLSFIKRLNKETIIVHIY